MILLKTQEPNKWVVYDQIVKVDVATPKKPTEGIIRVWDSLNTVHEVAKFETVEERDKKLERLTRTIPLNDSGIFSV